MTWTDKVLAGRLDTDEPAKRRARQWHRVQMRAMLRLVDRLDEIPNGEALLTMEDAYVLSELTSRLEVYARLYKRVRLQQTDSFLKRGDIH